MQHNKINSLISECNKLLSIMYVWLFNTGRGQEHLVGKSKKYYNPPFTHAKIQLTSALECVRNIQPSPLELIFDIPKFNCFFHDIDQKCLPVRYEKNHPPLQGLVKNQLPSLVPPPPQNPPSPNFHDSPHQY